MKQVVRREQSLAAFTAWLTGCGQPLLIYAPPYTGKTCFVRQLEAEPECAAVHYCDPADPSSLDASTLLRNLATQLVRRFPNVVLPYLSTVTLLADVSTAVDHYLALPLSSLPLPPKPLFVAIDDVQPPVYDIVFKLQSSLPCWLKLVVSTRSLPPEQYSLFSSSFHELRISDNVDELRSFVHQRLPQCCAEDVVQASHGSWFYVDQVGRALDYGMLLPDALPEGTELLLKTLCASPALPPRLNLYLMLIKAARKPPSHSDLLSVSQILINDVLPSIQKDLEDLAPILYCADPVMLSGSWVDFDGDQTSHHAAWAEHFKMKKRKCPQDLIELAYHLAHSDISPDDSRRTLQSLGVSQLSLKCAVFDAPTTELLQTAGVLIERPEEQEDFVFLCSLGDLPRLSPILSTVSSSSLSLGFLAAASRGHANVIEAILDRRPEVAHGSSSAEGHWNALRAAACGNHLKVLEMLIQRGICVDECGKGGRTALRAAAWAGHRVVVSCLMKANADVEKRDSEGRTALMAAAFMENFTIVEDLLLHGAKVNQVDNSGATALHLVLSNGCKSENHRRTVNTLIQYKADPNSLDSNGRACIHLAAYHGDECLEKIARFADHIDVQDLAGRTPLMLASSQGQIDSVQMLVSRGADIDAIDEEGRTALMLAAIGGHLDIVDLLLSLGADEGHKDHDGATALHYAVRHKCVELTRALATTATVTACDSSGNHPLIVAAQHPNVEVIRELLRAGANPEAQSLEGHTALRVAACAGHTEVVQALAQSVVDWEQRDLDGSPLLHTLLINNQLSMVALLIHLGSSPSSRDAHGRAATHVIASRDDVAAARLLLKTMIQQENGTEKCLFDERDDGGRTPLMTAVWAGHVSIAAFLLEVVGVEPNAVDAQGASALSVAAQLGQRDLVLLLLRFGSDPSLRDNAGRTAHDVARISGRENIKIILKSATGSADSSGFGSMPASPMDSSRPIVARRTSFVIAQY